MTSNYVSPNYEHGKLESPSYSDLVDVFEDRMRKWLLEPIQHLLTREHGDVPAISLALGYFEGVEIYCSGQDSKGTSKQFSAEASNAFSDQNLRIIISLTR